MKNLIYDYLGRNTAIKEQKLATLDYLYKHSYPKQDKDILELCKEHQDISKYTWPIDFFYMPHKIQKDIIDSRIEDYGYMEYWKESMEHLERILYVDGGYKNAYDENDRRVAEKLPLIKDIIGEEAAEKLREVLDAYKNFYKFGLVELNKFNSLVWSSPQTNRETVVKAWKETFNVDIEIPDDSEWKSSYDIEEEVDEGES